MTYVSCKEGRGMSQDTMGGKGRAARAVRTELARIFEGGLPFSYRSSFQAGE